MADTKISALTDGTTANTTDRIPIARSPFASSDNRYITPSYITGSATATEVGRWCDASARLVAVGGTSLALTEASHDGKIIKLDHTAAASTCTLPDATGSGAVFKFLVTAVNTNNHVIKVPDASNVIKGVVYILDADGTTLSGFQAAGTSDTITLNGTTTGGQLGDWLELVDYAADTWHVKGALVCPTGSNPATPFSATV